MTRITDAHLPHREALRELAEGADKLQTDEAVGFMGEVIHVNFADTKYSTTVQGVLSKRIQAKLDQLFPDRWNRADRIAAQAIGDMRNFDKRISFSLTLERPVDANGGFSEEAFRRIAEKLKADVEAQLHEIRKAAHLSIAATAYSTVINVAAPEDMLGQVTPAS